jgi:hypothetical protein
MTHVLIVGEKKSVVEQTIHFLASKNIIPKDALIDAAFSMPMSWWRWKIDRRIPLKSLPYTNDPTTLSDFPFNEKLRLAAFDYSFPGVLKSTDEKSTDGLINRFAESFDHYDQVIVFPDSDYNGIGSSLRWLRQVDKARSEMGFKGSIFDAERSIPFLWLSGLDEGSLQSAWDNRMPIQSPRLAELSSYFEAKYLFDFWWNCNGLPLFTETLKRAGCLHHQSMSKYELLTLHALERLGRPVGNEIFSAMENWRGTGRYPKRNPIYGKPPHFESFARVVCKTGPEDEPKEHGPYDWCYIGTPMSRAAIIDGLVDKGLVKSDKVPGRFGEVFEVTEAGRRFLSFCHKDTFDPDLPFRLHDWCKKKDVEAMKSYIRRFFGQQKRFLSKCDIHKNNY